MDYKIYHIVYKKLTSLSLSQIFPNADLRLLKQCVAVRDELLQNQYDKHKVQLLIICCDVKDGQDLGVVYCG